MDPIRSFPPRSRRVFWALMLLFVLLTIGMVLASFLHLGGGCINGCPR
jgi:hypothetical protein